MAISNKMDRAGVRTPADLERKYNFGKTFAELLGIADGARKSAAEANEKFDNMTQEQIFNLLTTDGENQGIYRDDDGNVYINASYIATGYIKFTKELFIEPGTKEAITIANHVTGNATIPDEMLPLYDFNGDGEVNIGDAVYAMRAANGEISLADWSGAKKTKFNVSINFFDPENTIRYVGSDMWGKTIDYSVGLGASFLKMENGGCMYRVDGDEKEWLNPPGVPLQEYRTLERYNGNPVYTKLVEVNFDEGGTKTVTTTIDFTKHSIIGINYVFDDSFSVYAAGSGGVSVVCMPGTDYYDLSVTAPSYGVCRVEIKYV